MFVPRSCHPLHSIIQVAGMCQHYVASSRFRSVCSMKSSSSGSRNLQSISRRIHHPGARVLPSSGPDTATCIKIPQDHQPKGLRPGWVARDWRGGMDGFAFRWIGGIAATDPPSWIAIILRIPGSYSRMILTTMGTVPSKPTHSQTPSIPHCWTPLPRDCQVSQASPTHHHNSS